MKFSSRHSPQSLSKSGEPDANGRLFFNNHGMTDLANVEIVGASVDTVRQLFYGLPNMRSVEWLQQALDAKEQFISLFFKDEKGNVVGERREFHLSKMGKACGYRYKLQNNDIGIVILFGAYYGLLDVEGQHVKIELSPKFISVRDAKTTMDYLRQIASKLLYNPQAKGCAVHLACDYQNFKLDDDFINRLSTYTRTIKAYDGINTLDISNLSESVVTYGGKKQERNYLIGKPNSVQMAIYDKSYEIIKSDKVDYFHDEWARYSEGVFDHDKTVRRIEARIHHTVIREIGLGMGIELEDFETISHYLTDIWRYALRINRFNYQQGRELVHPFWQLLLEDVQFTVPAQNIQIARKKKQSVDPVAYNITSLIGNFISLCFRQGYNADDIMVHLKVLPFYPRIKQYYKLRGKNETDIRDMVKESVLKRQLLSKLAA